MPSPSKQSGPTRGFLGTLSFEQSASLRSRAIPRRFRKGQPLFHENGPSDRVVALLDGRVKVFTTTAEGREIVLAFRGPGDLLGELSAIDEQPRSASAAAIEPVEALAVTPADFRAFLGEHPMVAVRLLETLGRRLRDADRKRVEYGAHDTAGRVAARLVEICEQYGREEEEGIAIDLPLSQEELAGWTGASREAVSKALQTLRAAGWIVTRRRLIVVRDLDALRRRSA